jgi:hypothetical protein
LVLTVNEDRSQTQAIHRQQREQQTIEGLLAKEERAERLRIHRNAQRLLKPLFVANPFARELTFLDSQTRTRRDHMKYLTLIRSIALLHQYQRPIKRTDHRGKTIEYIEVSIEDIEAANRLTHEILGRSLEDLPPQTRRLLLMIEEMVSKDCERLRVDRSDYRFSRRDVRRYVGWGNTQLKTHMARLEELEYLLIHHGGRGQRFVYELLFERGAYEEKPVLPGLINVDKLRYDGDRSGSSRTQVGGMSGSSRSMAEPVTMGMRETLKQFCEKSIDTGTKEKNLS